MWTSKNHISLYSSGRLLLFFLLQFQADVERKLSQMILDKKFHGESLHTSVLTALPPMARSRIKALGSLLFITVPLNLLECSALLLTAGMQVNRHCGKSTYWWILCYSVVIKVILLLLSSALINLEG